ncbi:MAG TPA: ROK family protein [Opitutaceae bacterium]|nr:ROK family protein [Opitutaceae bacterium]
MTQLWGIDLGGTKIEGAILDPSAPDRALHRLRLPTEASRGYDHVLGQIGRVVADLERTSGQRRPARMGFGTPGTTEPSSGLIKNSNTVCLNGRPLASDLSARLGLQALTTNDANCLALAEAALGAGRGHGVVLGLILGTGVGGGIVAHGRVLTGRHGIAGEWGHNPLRGEDTPCYCGRRGCIETVFSGPALERHYRESGGGDARLPEIARRAEAGEARAAATLERLRAKFGEALAAVINILDPDAVVIGGGVGNLGLLYEEPTRRAVLAHLFNPEFRTPLLRPVLGDSGGVFGAALLAAQEA